MNNYQFIPEQPKQAVSSVPWFDDVTTEEGWRGHTTGKPIDKLKLEVTASVERLGGQVVAFQQGSFLVDDKKRDGFRILYTITQANGYISRGRLDVAALPVKTDYRLQRSLKKRQEQSLKMALYMLREALDGSWFLQQLSPGFAALMPWMLEAGGEKTITQLWSESATFGHLLPSGESDFVEGEIVS